MIQPRTTTRPPAPSQIKILRAANYLFYTRGIHTVGVDRIIAEARVTKATFYKRFRSKDLLIITYVRNRSQDVRERVEALEDRLENPTDILRGMVEGMGAEMSRPDFRGCPFLNAAAQFTDAEHPVHREVVAHREWYAERIENLMRQLGHPRPGDAADDFIVARDGALAGGFVGDPVAANATLSRAAERIIAEAK